MKTKIEVQFQERNVDVKDTEKLVKENLKATGVKMNTIANLEIYYQQRRSIKNRRINYIFINICQKIKF